MKSAPDRHQKAGVLSLALQRFEASPKFKKTIPPQLDSLEPKEITSPEIWHEPPRHVSSKEKSRSHSKGRDKFEEKISTPRR